MYYVLSIIILYFYESTEIFGYSHYDYNYKY